MIGGVQDALIRARAWHVYIAFCLVVWVVLITRPGAWPAALEQWPMALVMIGGSLVAGSTPMGGGTVAFPALVLGFQESPAMARDFGLAIQSVGMTSALLFILLVRRIPVESRLLMWGSVGATAGLTFGTFALAGWVPAAFVKLLFATLWITFGVWLVAGTARERSNGPRSTGGAEVVPIGIATGFVGGAVMSLIGVGPEMAIYAALVLRFGWPAKAAVPTAVCATALMAPVGLLLRAATAGIDPAVYPVWLAATPIVIFGAPAGAYIAARMPRVLLLRIIGALCLLQFIATVVNVQPSPAQWGGVVVMGVVSAVGLWLLAPSQRAVAATSAVTERQA